MSIFIDISSECLTENQTERIKGFILIATVVLFTVYLTVVLKYKYGKVASLFFF